MLDDADVPPLFAFTVACLLWFASAVPDVLLAALGGLLIGTAARGALQGVRCAARLAGRLAARRRAPELRTAALLAMACLIGCRAPGR